jgi:hypothetical protein
MSTWTDFSIALLVVLNITHIGLYLYASHSKKKLVSGLSNIIHDFEKERSVLLHIEAVNPDNVYLRNPRSR